MDSFANLFNIQHSVLLIWNLRYNFHSPFKHGHGVVLVFFLVSRQHFVDKNDFDMSVRAQDDLFEHVNGTWLKNTKIPSDKSNFGAFTVLIDLSQSRIKTIIDEVSKGNNVKGTDEQRVADLFRSYMNEDRANELGMTPIKDELALVAAIENKTELVDWFAKFSKFGIGSPIAAGVSQDKGNATEHIMYLSQSGTTLPDRDYYLKDDKQAERDHLLAYMEKLFELANLPEQRKLAKAVLELEIELAKAQWSRVEMRDANKTYNKMDMPSLNKLSGDAIDWKKYFVGNDVPEAIEMLQLRCYQKILLMLILFYIKNNCRALKSSSHVGNAVLIWCQGER